MPLRIKGTDRPGFAIFEFDGPMSADTLSFSLKSVISRGGLYLTNDGNWEKAPHYFSAARLGSDASTTLYGVGPEVVNHVFEQDTVEIATSDEAHTFETVWENATPELLGSPRSGWVHVPKNDDRSPSDAPKTTGVTKEPGDNPSEARSDDEKAADRRASSNPGAIEGQANRAPRRPGPSRALIIAFVVVGLVVMAAAAALWLLPEQRCRWFGGTLGGCGDIESAIACISQKTAASPCGVALACAVDPDSPTWSQGQSERLRRALGRAGATCTDREGETASRTDACLSDLETRANACGAADCMAIYTRRFPNGSAIDAFRQRVANDDARCNAEHDAAQVALVCADSQEREGLYCDLRRKCIDPYARAYPRGATLAQLRPRADAANVKCEASRVEKDASDCAMTNRARPCQIDDLCIAPSRARLGAGQASETLDGLSRDAADACRRSTPPNSPLATLPSAPDATPPVPAGAYSGSVAPACGEPRRSVAAEVSGDRITWSHRDFDWSGRIDPDQNLTGTALGAGVVYSADGVFPNRVVMHYPDCTFTVTFRLK